MELQTIQEIEKERDDLSDRYDSFSTLLKTVAYSELPQKQKNAMADQKRIMEQYLSVLNRRIERFEKGWE